MLNVALQEACWCSTLFQDLKNNYELADNNNRFSFVLCNICFLTVLPIEISIQFGLRSHYIGCTYIVRTHRLAKIALLHFLEYSYRFFSTNEKLSTKISRQTARITYDAGVSENEW